MNLAEYYIWLKAAHVAAALLFVAGVSATALALAVLSAMPQADRQLVSMILRYDRWITVPAMIAVWLFGIGLALSGGWLGQGWLNVKLGLVVLLSGLHGLQAGRLRKIAAGGSPSVLRSLPLVVLATIGIAILAVAKP